LSEVPAAPLLPHLRIPGFLDANQHAMLFDWTLANEERFMPAQVAGGLIEPRARTALTLRDLGPMATVFADRLRESAPAWTATLRATPFETTGVELELAAHNDGAHFTLHSDTYSSAEPSRGDRMLSAVYYFHRQPRAFEGGSLSRAAMTGIRQAGRISSRPRSRRSSTNSTTSARHASGSTRNSAAIFSQITPRLRGSETTDQIAAPVRFSWKK
jgi:hypothetical protein